jgi:serine/threonine-protein kinase RsbT
MMDRAASGICISIRDESDVVVARRHTREQALQQGLAEPAAEALVIAVTELARNIVVHAGSGEIFFSPVADASRRGLIVTARDSGPGIPDIEEAMRDGFSTGSGLGLGLPGARRLADEFRIDSEAGAGTTVTLWKWAPARPR